VEQTFGEVTLELVRGDITNQSDCMAIVNAANARLRMGGGVAGAIHRAAGSSLEEETCKLAPIQPGEAVLSGGHNLSNWYIIHCLGPVYDRDKPEDKLLANCYSNTLNIAEKHAIDSVVFPALSTGAFGYPMEPTARVALQTVINEIPKLKAVKLIRCVVWGARALKIHEDVFVSMID